MPATAAGASLLHELATATDLALSSHIAGVEAALRFVFKSDCLRRAAQVLSERCQAGGHGQDYYEVPTPLDHMARDYIVDQHWHASNRGRPRVAVSAWPWVQRPFGLQPRVARPVQIRQLPVPLRLLLREDQLHVSNLAHGPGWRPICPGGPQPHNQRRNTGQKGSSTRTWLQPTLRR